MYGYDQDSLTRTLNKYLLPAVIGLSPFDLALVHQRLDRVTPYNLMAKAAVDLACYDLAARIAGLPMHALIGGKRTERVPMISTVDMVPPEAAAEMTRELTAKNYTTIKIKIGGRAEDDLARVAAVRRAAGDQVNLRVGRELRVRPGHGPDGFSPHGGIPPGMDRTTPARLGPAGTRPAFPKAPDPPWPWTKASTPPTTSNSAWPSRRLG